MPNLHVIKGTKGFMVVSNGSLRFLDVTNYLASHWPAGPSSGHVCWRAQVRPRASQAHIRECLGQQEPVPTQVMN